MPFLRNGPFATGNLKEPFLCFHVRPYIIIDGKLQVLLESVPQDCYVMINLYGMSGQRQYAANLKPSSFLWGTERQLHLFQSRYVHGCR
jgi:hypothetical protein